MQFWYGIIRSKFGKIRSKRISKLEALTQEAFLALMEYNPRVGDVVLELDLGNHMEHTQFMSYVSLMYQSGKRVTITDLESMMSYN